MHQLNLINYIDSKQYGFLLVKVLQIIKNGKFFTDNYSKNHQTLTISLDERF